MLLVFFFRIERRLAAEMTLSAFNINSPLALITKTQNPRIQSVDLKKNNESKCLIARNMRHNHIDGNISVNSQDEMSAVNVSANN